MSFVSYAQNFEDVMLWRALKHVEHGRYIDVGAQHPVIDSVSKAFYEHGWRGVHVEPVAAYADLLRRDRPDETVLQLALSDTDGVIELNVIPNTGLSTAVGEYAERYAAEQGFAYTTTMVPMLTMKTAMQFLDGEDVHWMKVDVEGFEEQVLRGWDASRLRPWILVVEATVPTKPDVAYTAWEPLVTGAGYRFAYFDGLNRFYVADEHAELLEAFTRPPNVFDGAMLSGLANSDLCRGVIKRHQDELAQANGVAERELAAERELNLRLNKEVESLRELDRLVTHIKWLEGHYAMVEGEVARLNAHIEWMQGQWNETLRANQELSSNAQALRRQVQDIHGSTSWRLTAPMRRAVSLARRIKSRLGGSQSVPAQLAEPAKVAPPAVPAYEQVLRELSPRATQILAEIRQVIESKAR